MSLLPSTPLPLLAAALILCLAVSSLGFRRVDWFISIGYGLSVAAQALLFSLLYGAVLDFWLIAQQGLLLAYGLRLAFYLIAREQNPSFARELEASRQRSVHIRGAAKLAIWVSVSALYVTMYAPGLLSLVVASHGASLATLPAGTIIMLLGFGLEAAADAQKLRLKAAHPSRFVSSGLFALVRSPNYFGEMLFWSGVFVSGIAAYATPGDWLLAGIGLVCIELLMLGSARRLELKQAEHYGGDPAFEAYVRNVPALIPFVPLYSLRNLKIYLG